MGKSRVQAAPTAIVIATRNGCTAFRPQSAARIVTRQPLSAA